MFKENFHHTTDSSKMLTNFLCRNKQWIQYKCCCCYATIFIFISINVYQWSLHSSQASLENNPYTAPPTPTKKYQLQTIMQRLDWNYYNLLMSAQWPRHNAVLPMMVSFSECRSWTKKSRAKSRIKKFNIRSWFVYKLVKFAAIGYSRSKCETFITSWSRKAEKGVHKISLLTILQNYNFHTL